MNVTVLDRELDRETYLQQLQAIHALRAELGLSNEAYRALLRRLTGSSSSKYMTREQRQRVITFMSVHKAIDEAIALAEEARDTLNEAYELSEANMMEKVIMLDSKEEARMLASTEDVIATMRELHGSDIRLVGVKERRQGDLTTLELAFERPALYLLAS